jgi:serine/threonine-protein kinase
VAKILDFGVSKISDATTVLTHEIALLGTPAYMAPEQVAGGEVDARSDVNALAAIAYYAMTGRNPHGGATLAQLAVQICSREPIPVGELRDGVPAAVDDVLAIGMAKNPKERYQNALEFSTDFAAALAGELSEEVRERARAVHRGEATALAQSTASSGTDALSPTLTTRQ